MKHTASLSRGLSLIHNPQIIESGPLNIQGKKMEKRQMNYTVGVGGQMSIQGSLMKFDDLQLEPDQRDDDPTKQAIRFELESQGTV